LHRAIQLHFSCDVYRVHLDLHSFPTRRSSDLKLSSFTDLISCKHQREYLMDLWIEEIKKNDFEYLRGQKVVLKANPQIPEAIYRSEEHTSELQSRENLVCRLLLEKKKNTQ